MPKIFKSALLITAICFLITPASLTAQEPAVPASANVEDLVAVQGDVANVDIKETTVTVKDPKNTDTKTNTVTLIIDQKTTTIWGEFDEIMLSELPVGAKIAGEYKVNPSGTNTATYLEIITEEEVLPEIEETEIDETEEIEPETEEPVE